MNADIRNALLEEGSRAPDARLETIGTIERLGRRRQLATWTFKGFGAVAGLIVLIAIPAVVRGPANLSDSDGRDVVAPVESIGNSSARLLELPFEPGTVVVRADDRLYVTAGSSSDPDEPGQIYYSDDLGVTWEPVLEAPRGMRFGPIKALGPDVLASGFYEYVPEEPPDPLDEGGFVASPWTVRMDDGESVLELIGGDTFEMSDLVTTDSQFLALTLERGTDVCEILASDDGVSWSTDRGPRCPEGMRGIADAGDYVLGFGEGPTVWVLRGSEFLEADLGLDQWVDLIAGDQQPLWLERPVSDGTGQLVVYGRQTQMVGMTPVVQGQRIFAARSFDGISWELETLDTEGEVFPYGITGLENGFLAVVAGEVLRSRDGMTWESTGQDLGADVWSWESGVIVDGSLLVPVGPAAQSVDPARPRQMAVIAVD